MLNKYVSLDDIKLRILQQRGFSDDEYLDLNDQSLADVNINSGITFFNRHCGVRTSLGNTQLWGNLGSKKLRDSVIFINYTPKERTGALDDGCFRYDLKNNAKTELFIPSEFVDITIQTDIYGVGESPFRKVHKIIKSNNTVMILDNYVLGKEKYGNLITLFSLFERDMTSDKRPKYSFIKYRDDVNYEDWKIISLRCKADFENLLKNVPNDALFEALAKRLKSIMDKTDFKFLGYNK